MRIALFLFVGICFSLDLTAQSCAPDSVVSRSIKAILTDSTIDWEWWEHQVYFNPDCPPNNKLLVHLVGSYDNPASTTYFPALAASRGYKAISLKYPNDVSPTFVCKPSADPDCYVKFRQEVVHGTDNSSAVTVDSSNCIVNRLEKLLVYLDGLYPTEGWNSFLTGQGNVNWPEVVVSGHSQGGGHAAFMAKTFDVDRVLMFASPNDYSSFFAGPASWASAPGTTPDSSHYAFGNRFDDVIDFNEQYQIWSSLGLSGQGDSTNVDQGPCPYNNSRILYTEDTSAMGGSGNHNSVIIDNFTPISSGNPVFAPVWEYMLGTCDISTSTSPSQHVGLEFKAFPNPVATELSIDCEETIAQVELYDVSGRLVKTFRPMERSFRLELGNCNGLLLLKLISASSKTSVVKVRCR